MADMFPKSPLVPLDTEESEALKTGGGGRKNELFGANRRLHGDIVYLS